MKLCLIEITYDAVLLINNLQAYKQVELTPHPGF